MLAIASRSSVGHSLISGKLWLKAYIEIKGASMKDFQYAFHYSQSTVLNVKRADYINCARKAAGDCKPWIIKLN